MKNKIKKKLKSIFALVLSFLLIFSSISGFTLNSAADEKQSPATILSSEEVKSKEESEELVSTTPDESEETPNDVGGESSKDEVDTSSSGTESKDETTQEINDSANDLKEKETVEKDNNLISNDEKLEEETEKVNSFDEMYNPDHLTPEDVERESKNTDAGRIQYFNYIQPMSFMSINQDNSVNQGEINQGEIGKNHPENPGDVMVYKEATPVDGMVNTWDITLRIEGKDTKETSDIVLVIDRSGSMGDNGRMISAKNAAKAFVDELLPSDTTRIGIVSFAGDVSVNSELTSDKSDLKSKIENLKADGGTFTQAGIKQAEEMLKDSSADHKHIVLLSDGVPTYSYEINNPDKYLSDQYIDEGSYYYNIRNVERVSSFNINGNRPATTTDVSENDFSDNRIGAGTNMFHRYYPSHSSKNSLTDKYYNHGNSTIAQAGFAKDIGQTVWSIALSAGAQGEEVLQKVASPGNYYTATPQNLENIFENIAGSINSAVKDAEVQDPMGEGFEIPAAKVTDIKTVPENPGASYNSETKKITWNPILTAHIEEGSDIKYAELKYRVEINNDILKVQSKDGFYPTNGNATISYTDANGVPKTPSFPVPKVNPVFYTIEKVLQDEDGNLIENSNEKFTVNVKGDNYNHHTKLNPKEVKTITDLRDIQTYTFEEIDYNKNIYDVTYYVDDEETNVFTVNSNNDNDKKIKVVNKLKSTPVDVEKIVTGNMGNKDEDFKFSYKIEKNPTENFTLNDGDKYSLKYSKTINVPYGATITITENSNDYDTTIKTNQTKVTNTSNEKNQFVWTNKGESTGFTVTFTNEKDIPVPTGISDNQDPIIVALALALISGLALIISKKRKKVNY